MKALILAGGRGKRLEELTLERNKCLTPVGGRPVIEYSLEVAANSPAIKEIVIVVGYRAEDIINKYGICYKGKTITYVIQWEQKGLVHAIECAQESLMGSDFILLLADEVMMNPRHQQMIEEFYINETFVTCGILHVDDKDLIRRTYTIVQSDEGSIFRLVEKPKRPLNNWMGTGDCVFRNKIFDYIESTPIHHLRKEKELPDLIQCAIDDGMAVKSFVICDRYTNINTKEDITMGESFFKP